MFCNVGVWNEPDYFLHSPHYGQEICDDRDNNCDGIADNVSRLGEACSDGLGACIRSGLMACDIFSGELRCDAQAGNPVAEICNGIDNNCDGIVDNVSGLGEACFAGFGACRSEGILECQPDSAEPQCSAVAGEPGIEICDGLDNNCDGTVDNVLLENIPLASIQNGVCDGARMFCNVGAWNEPDYFLHSPHYGQEICDDRDNNCDGIVDNVSGLGEACFDGLGECRREGILECQPDSAEPQCNAVAGQPGIEICDGLDNNCDGTVDNVPAGQVPLADIQLGVCAGARKFCNGVGVWTEPNYFAYSPHYGVGESCDGRDNNCNGAVDEGMPDADGDDICDDIDPVFNLINVTANSLGMCINLQGTTCPGVDPATFPPYVFLTAIDGNGNPRTGYDFNLLKDGSAGMEHTFDMTGCPETFSPQGDSRLYVPGSGFGRGNWYWTSGLWDLIVTYVPASGLGTDSAMTYYLRQDLGGGQSCILARYNHCNLDENQISKTCP
jgi:hypothetical protein